MALASTGTCPTESILTDWTMGGGDKTTRLSGMATSIPATEVIGVMAEMFAVSSSLPTYHAKSACTAGLRPSESSK